ncbi:MAG: hypothetical protein ACRDFQ_04570 [Anaerolineales bacterium]
MEIDRNRLPTLIISAAIGALVGLGAGIVLLRRAQEKGLEKAISPREGLSLGLLVLGLLKQISQLGNEE